jgi:hypothetical protein
VATRKPIVGQLAFRGNVRGALKKFSDSISSLILFQKQHPDWPVQLWTNRQLQTLLGLQSSAEASRVARVPAPPQM